MKLLYEHSDQFSVLLSVCFLAFLKVSFSQSIHPILMIIAFDGFRYDYIDKGLTPVLEVLKNTGSSTKFMYNVFPTLTSPNLFSIATGLYPETHGVLANRAFNHHFKCLNDEELAVYELFHYNDQVVPLWNLNEMTSADRHSGTILWPGSQFGYQNRNLTYTVQNRSTTYMERVDTSIKWILDPKKPANLIFLYFDQPDIAGHHHGPDSEQVLNELQRINNVTEHLLQKLADNNLRDKVDLIFLSDHGMAELSPHNIINFDEYVRKDKMTICGESPILFVKSLPGYEHEIYENFTRAAKEFGTFIVYNQSTIPDSWHIKNSKRMADSLLVARLGYGFTDVKNFRGDHGYDFADQLRPFFVANGPSIKSNNTVTPFHNIDIYPLVRKMLQLLSPDEYLKSNGTLAIIQKILRN